MGKKIITVSLSEDSIQSAIQEIFKYKQELEQKLEHFVERMAQYGVSIAKMQLVDMNATFSGDLINSICYEKRSNLVFVVKAGTDHCAFVEFGTGFTGQEHDYPVDFPNGVDWKYASGKTIREVYPGVYGWTYHKNGRWYFTRGMASRPYMHNTSMELITIAEKVAREVF